MAPVLAGSDDLRILPNRQININNFPHQTDTDGSLIQTKTVRTVVRVGLAGTLPAAPMRLTMSLRDGSGEITAHRVTTGKPMYDGTRNSITQEMRPEVPPQAESDGGDSRAACVAEATFDFKFSVTAAQVRDNSTTTKVWLRFTVDGSPNLYVETPHFRLVAKKDSVRESVQTLVVSALKSAKQVSADLGKAKAMPPDSQADQQIINDCLGLEQQLRARLQQHSAFHGAGTNGGGALVTVSDDELTAQHAINDSQFTGAAAAHGALPLQVAAAPLPSQSGAGPSVINNLELEDEDELNELLNDVDYQTVEGADLAS